MTFALQKSECCSATSAAQHSENCSAAFVFACGMLQGWALEGWGLGLADLLQNFPDFPIRYSRAAKRGVSNGGVSRSGLVLPFLSFLGLSQFFWDFPPIKSTCEDQSRNGPRHNLDLSRKKWETPPGLETPRFSFSQAIQISGQKLQITDFCRHMATQKNAADWLQIVLGLMRPHMFRKSVMSIKFPP